MIIYIKNADGIFKNDFIKYIIKYIQKKFRAKLNIRKLKVWDDFLNDERLSKLKLSNKIYAKDILLLAVSNLIFKKVGNDYIIEVSPNAKLYRSDVRLSTACKLIAYGTSEMKPYSLLLDIFKYVEDNINKIYYEWVESL